MLRNLLLVPLALVLLAPAAAAADYTFIMYLHEGPLHIAPERLEYTEGDRLSILVGNPEGNNGTYVLRVDGYALETPPIAPGRAAYLNFTLDQAGVFEYGPPQSFYRDGGMRGTLTVHAGSGGNGDGDGGGGGNGTPAPAALAALAAAGAAAVFLRRRA